MNEELNKDDLERLRKNGIGGFTTFEEQNALIDMATGFLTIRSQLATLSVASANAVKELATNVNEILLLRSQLADAQAQVARLKGQLEEAGKALSGLGYTPSADDSGSYDSLIPDEYL